MTETSSDLKFTDAEARGIRRRLLAWYRKEHRQMPWRAEPPDRPNPYHVLVSEAMLQQTQVATVMNYFERFVDEFPTVHALAEADEQRVLRLWQGLGYYRRARNLHAAAKMIVQQFDGQVPAQVQALLKLPGVGRYTAGAIASIAYDTPAPIVDGNVDRVIARLLNLTEPVDRSDVKKQIWALADQLVPEKNAGDFNQSVMELGATVCTPKAPKCLVCPLGTLCRARAVGEPERLPDKQPKKKPTNVTHVIFAVHRGGKYLFAQRPGSGLWSNMWQMPTLEDVAMCNGSAESTARNAHHQDADAWFAEQFGLSLMHTKSVCEFSHQTTHRTIRFLVNHAEVKTGRTRPGSGQWRKLSRLDDIPLANPQRIAIQRLVEYRASNRL